MIRSGTVGQLERRKTGNDSIYRYYPIQVASIDFLKSDRNRHLFLLDCPELVIVDEGAWIGDILGKESESAPASQSGARDRGQGGATPYSPDSHASQRCRNRFPFAALVTSSEIRRVGYILVERVSANRTGPALCPTNQARHRDRLGRRGTAFLGAIPRTKPIDLSSGYRDLFHKTYDFCSEIVKTGQSLNKRQQRVRYWGALALLRCVMSSPAAAGRGVGNAARCDSVPTTRNRISDRLSSNHPKIAPTTINPRRRLNRPRPRWMNQAVAVLRELGRTAANLLQSPDDKKLAGCADLVSRLLQDGFHPIVWCRYIATAEYVAEGAAAGPRTSPSRRPRRLDYWSDR
ncbi:MAG: hypothetical protein KatS3mg082_1996 [Nitrospiraceae bacterium]|nr:MAG: hypothetical protein KatS3mg082_1996 [Nitrospiraceae bacterium]